MSIAKVASGQPLRISAEAFNAFVDAASAYQTSRQSRSADGSSVLSVPGVVLVRNDSGSDQDRFAVLGLDGPLILPSENQRAFCERLAFAAVTPDEEAHANRFCILQEPIAAGALGRGLLLGATPVLLQVTAEDDAYAAVVTDDVGGLTTGSQGGARLLWAEPGTGARWGIVQIPAGGAASAPHLAVSAVPETSWVIGTVLRWDGSAWIRADAGAVGPADTLGVVGTRDAGHALVVLWGLFCLDGLTPHTDYWLDPSASGELTTTKPADSARLVLHHAQDGLCILRAGSGGGAGSGAERFADLTDVDVTTVPPTDGQAALWDAATQRWKARSVIRSEPVPAHAVLAGPTTGGNALPTFRALVVDDLNPIAATSVVANATGAVARPTLLVAPADDRVLLRSAGQLQWLQVPTGAIADKAVTAAKIASVAWATITDAPTAYPVGGDLIGTTANARLRAGAVTTAALAAGAVTDDKVTSVAWSKITGAPSGGDDPQPLGGDLTGTTADAHLAPGAVVTTSITDAAVTNAKLQHDSLRIGGVDYHLGDTVTGLLTNPMTTAGDLLVGGAAGAPTRLPGNAGGTLQVLTSKAGVTKLVTHTLDALEDATITAPLNGQVLTYDAPSSQWRNRAPGAATIDGLSVLGNESPSAAPAAPIAATADYQVLTSYLNRLTWMRLPYAAMDNVPGLSVLGRPDATLAAPQAITATADFSLLARVGSALGFRSTLPRVSIGSGAGGFLRLISSAPQTTHEYAADTGAFTQLVTGRMRFATSATAYWEIVAATNGIEIVGVTASGPTHRIRLDAAALSTGGVGRTLTLREIDVCENGVARKMMILASPAY